MIHYQLICSADHSFDGWFRDSAAFDRQAEAGLVECPSCGDVRINRALMAPAIGRSRKARQPGAEGTAPSAPSAPAPATSAPMQALAAALPDEVRAVLQKIRAEVERTCEHVGDRFAEEARAIHNGETANRPIYGAATPEQAEALADDGIEVSQIPWIPRADG